jgi:hypothetical protein
MPAATYAVSNFLGGEISQFAQGRFDRPDYRVSLNVCVNAFPVEIGTWTRRPGSAYGGNTRTGAAGRVIEFDFEQADAVTCEYTSGFVRFRSGTVLIGTNDDQPVVSVSNANPAVVQVANAVTWSTGNTVLFRGAATPLIENRQLTITSIDSTHFSLADALTGQNIDGSTLGALVADATVSRVQELATVYVGTAWQNIRSVQAETTQILLAPGLAPQALTVSTMPSTGISSQFAIQAALFNDGPYLDPFTNGVQVSPSLASGLVDLTLSFAVYSSTTAYAKGSFVTSSGIDYISLADQNVGNTPATSPTFWAATTAGAAINNGKGFLASDVGRLVRLLSEPTYFDPATTYTAGQTVSYNPSGLPGGATYWQALTTTTSTPPGATLTDWQIIPQGAAIWTWGKITGLSNIINRNLAGSVAIGDMAKFNGVNAAFDGIFSKSISSSAAQTESGGFLPAGTQVTLNGFVGKNFTGATPQQIQQVSVFPSVDRGFGFGAYVDLFGTQQGFFPSFTINLRAKQTAPSDSSDGKLLGTISFSGSSPAVTIISSDQMTAWNYVWVELIMTTNGATTAQSYGLDITIAQLSLYNPTGTASSTAGCTAEILGPALIYTGTPILTWRLGAYSDTTGWPTCGCYADGRLWLGGAIANRFDACTSNGLLPSSNVIDFAPTDQYGNVADDNAISETINADSTNPIYWMQPDLQGILIGTQGGEFLLQAPTTGSISPSNITSRRTTRIGSSNIEPRRTDHTLAFVKRYGRKLMEYFADVFSGKFSAPNLAERAQHIPRTGIAEIAYTEGMTPIIWGRNEDGSLFGITYKRDALTTSQGPTYSAWHRHALGSGRIVESISGGPSVGGDLDSLSMVTNDASTNIRHVEVLTDTPDELTAMADWWYLDDAVNPTSISVTTVASDGAPYGGVTINGLWPHNGKTVQVFAGGCDCGDRGDLNEIVDFPVANGSIFVPFGDGISAGPGAGQFTQDFLATLPLTQIVVGFTYDSDGQLVRRIEPQEAGSRSGPALGLIGRDHRYAMLVSNSLGISVGTSFDDLKPALFKQKDDHTPIPPLTPFSGIHQDTLEDDYSYGGMLCWRISRPFAANVVAVAGNMQTQDQ